MKTIVLMGIKHCGKSTQGRIISEKLNVPFFDTDDVIFEETKLTPRDIYAKSGENAFKEAEAHACLTILNEIEETQNVVIATGGGICNNPKALSTLKKCGTFVFLKASEKTAADRIVREVKTDENGVMSNLPAYIAKKNPRTIEDVRDIFHEFYEERTKLYSEIADITIEMDNLPKSENASLIIEHCRS